MKRRTISEIWNEERQKWIELIEKDVGGKLEKEWLDRNLAMGRELLLGILGDRFGRLPAYLLDYVGTCADPVRLRAATRKACVIASLDDFQL